MDNAILFFVNIIHLFVVLFVTLTPFYGNNYVLFVHSIVVPFIIIHWVYNDDTCFLTQVELSLRRRMNNNVNIDKNDCLTCRIMSPIYNVTTQHKEYTTSIYFITLLLWSISVSKLCFKYKNGEIKGILDIITPTNNLYQFY